MNLFTKQKQSHRFQKQTYGDQRGKLGGRGTLEVSHGHTTIFKIDNQQGPAVYHRELYPIFYYNLNSKWEKALKNKIYIYICTYITEVLCLHLKLTKHCKSITCH